MEAQLNTTRGVAYHRYAARSEVHGELGCAISHKALMRAAERIHKATNGTKAAETSFMVLEDDFVFKPNATATLQRLGELSPNQL